MQPDIPSGGKVPRSCLKVEIVKSILTSVETEAQRDYIASMWPSETKMLESGFEGRHLFDFRAGNGGIFSQIPWP